MQTVNILIVDDSSIQRQVIIGMLNECTHYKYNTYEAENGKDGIELLMQKSYDAIITDINMPIMDGFEFASRARRIAQYRTVPIIVLTANTSQAANQYGKACEVSHWLSKPIEAKKLNHILKTFLDRYLAMKNLR